jgi:hypothetical protein
VLVMYVSCGRQGCPVTSPIALVQANLANAQAVADSMADRLRADGWLIDFRPGLADDTCIDCCPACVVILKAMLAEGIEDYVDPVADVVALVDPDVPVWPTGKPWRV